MLTEDYINSGFGNSLGFGKEACGDRNEDIQKANLFDLQAKYTDVVSETDALKWMKIQ